jgi:hypothetical protein
MGPHLVVGAKPADLPGGFLLDAFLVERDEAHQDVVVAQVGRPAIGGDGGIQFVVAFLQDQHEAVIEDAPVGGVQGIGRVAGAEFLQQLQRPVSVMEVSGSSGL